MRKSERGQALFETTVFLPLMLIALVAIMYFSQYGVLQGRAVEAVRYASLVTNGGAATQANSIFTIESMYAELWREGQNPGSNPGQPTTKFACNGSGTKADTAAALAIYQEEALPNAIPTSTAPAFFQANGTAPAGSCTAQSIYLQGAANIADVADSFFIVQYTSVTATQKVPHILGLMGVGQAGSSSGNSSVVTAGMGYTLPANPASAIYCSPNFAQIMDKAITPQQPISAPNATAAPYGGYATPSSTTNC